MSLLSFRNRNVSQVWFIFLIAWVALVALGWKLFVAIEEIDAHTQAITETQVEF